MTPALLNSSHQKRGWLGEGRSPSPLTWKAEHLGMSAEVGHSDTAPVGKVRLLPDFTVTRFL